MFAWKRGFLAVMALVLGIPAAAAVEYEPLPLLDPAAVSDRFFTNPMAVYDIGDPFLLPAEGRKPIRSSFRPVRCGFLNFQFPLR